MQDHNNSNNRTSISSNQTVNALDLIDNHAQLLSRSLESELNISRSESHPGSTISGSNSIGMSNNTKEQSRQI